MGDIFASTKEIPVWIGDSDDMIREDFDVVHRVR